DMPLGVKSRAFFFSSRRRHTRFSRDWSSDVCSSDLFSKSSIVFIFNSEFSRIFSNHFSNAFPGLSPRFTNNACFIFRRFHSILRSEERRVGKEWRSRG